MISWKIRDAAPEDVQEVMGLWRRAYNDDGGNRLREDADRLAAGVPQARLLLAVNGDAVVGALIAGFDGWRGNMYGMAVDPDLRRQGIATALVAEAEEWLASVGCQRIAAMVVMDHPWATGFWQSAGYECDDFMRRYTHNLSSPM